MQDLNIGVVQTKLYWKDKEANFAHFEKLFSTHFSGKDVDLILLPEMFNTGFSMNVKELAESMNGRTIKWMRDRAAEMNCEIAGSLIVEENSNYYNRMVIVNGDDVRCTYDKRHLFRLATENEYFSPGNERKIYEIKGWRILLQICYDLRFPVFSRNKIEAGKKDYDLCIYIANWPEKRVYAWRNLLQARAIENQAYCVGVNRIGDDGNGIAHSGDSMVVDPWGIIETDCADHKETVRICTLRSKKLDAILEKFPTLLDAD